MLSKLKWKQNRQKKKLRTASLPSALQVSAEGIERFRKDRSYETLPPSVFAYRNVLSLQQNDRRKKATDLFGSKSLRTWLSTAGFNSGKSSQTHLREGIRRPVIPANNGNRKTATKGAGRTLSCRRSPGLRPRCPASVRHDKKQKEKMKSGQTSEVSYTLHTHCDLERPSVDNGIDPRWAVETQFPAFIW